MCIGIYIIYLFDQRQSWPPPPWPPAWPRQYPGGQWGAYQKWRTRSQSPPAPYVPKLKKWKSVMMANLWCPTILEKERSLLATSSGCSMKLVVESITPGTKTWCRILHQGLNIRKFHLVFRDLIFQLFKSVHLMCMARVCRFKQKYVWPGGHHNLWIWR